MAFTAVQKSVKQGLIEICGLLSIAPGEHGPGNGLGAKVIELVLLIIAFGAESRISMGTAVIGGTIMACVAGTLLVPIFFKVVQGLREKVHGGETRSPSSHEAPSEPPHEPKHE